jgi:polar amino acid transport system ATP-binding protein
MSNPIIDIKNLSKSFGSHQVLHNIDFSVQPSQVVVVIGPSGSGKSTFLRCMNGLETAEGGTLHACGHTVVEDGQMMSEAKLDALRSEVGMVFQSFNLFPHLSVLHNITLAPMALRNTSRQDADAQGMRLLEKVGLGHKANVFPGTLSGGPWRWTRR